MQPRVPGRQPGRMADDFRWRGVAALFGDRRGLLDRAPRSDPGAGIPTLVAPLEERRQPLPFPSPRLLLQANGNFADGLNAWFDDRVGFRDLFIRTKNQIDYSPVWDIAQSLCRQGWLAVRPRSGRSPRSIHARSDDGPRAELRHSGRCSLVAGIRLVVVGHPDKVANLSRDGAAQHAASAPTTMSAGSGTSSPASRRSSLSTPRRCSGGKIEDQRTSLRQDRFARDRGQRSARGQGNHRPHR